MSEIRQLLTEALQGKQESREKLFVVLRRDGRARGAIRNLSRNAACMEVADVESEFWRGVLLGLGVVREDIGDPVAHLIQRGVWQVKTAMREELSRKIVQKCIMCGKINGSYDYGRRCKACGGSVENLYRLEPYEQLEDTRSYLDSVASVWVTEIKHLLHGRQREVFESLLDALHENPETPVASAAKATGMSRQRFHQHLKKIRNTMGILT